jgi:cysteine desulfurase/selenocysteine lyase
LEEQGVTVTQAKAKNHILTPEELEAHITKKTKLFCISHVHTFSGFVLDVKAFGEICRKHNVLFILNTSQSMGSMPVDVSDLYVDGVVCAGYKWICGPYGTGFAWIKPGLRETLKWNNTYWQFVLSGEELQSEEKIVYHDIKSAKRFDIFATANFFNFVPFKTAIDFLLDVKLEIVQKYNSELIDQFISGLDQKKYRLISPAKGPARSGLIVFSHQDSKRNDQIHRDLIAKGIYTALWKNNIRVSPHIYNTSKDIQTLLDFLNKI